MKTYIFSAIILSFILLGCKSSSYVTGEQTYISKPSKDIIRIKSIGYSDKKYVSLLGICFASRKKSAINNAKNQIFKTLLFDGISGSEIYYPLIHSSEQSKARRNKYFDALINNEKYLKYVEHSEGNLKFTLDSQSKRTRVETILDINITSLRKDLENHGIIKKFGL